MKFFIYFSLLLIVIRITSSIYVQIFLQRRVGLWKVRYLKIIIHVCFQLLFSFLLFKFFYDTTKSPLFEFVFISQVYSLFVHAFCGCGMAMNFVSFGIHFVEQFKIIRHEIELLNSENCKKITLNLIAARHAKILSNFKKFNNLSLFGNFVTVTLAGVKLFIWCYQIIQVRIRQFFME